MFYFCAKFRDEKTFAEVWENKIKIASLVYTDFFCMVYIPNLNTRHNMSLIYITYIIQG